MSIRSRLCLVTVVLLFLSFAPAAVLSDDSPKAQKAYSPFDEPRPPIPSEILNDKRLDVKFKVFVKSMNVKQLFSELTSKTGVKITVSRKLWGERPIVYFHKRPLRDVMTEISGLYGYRWLISGKAGAYEYELFEDIRHAKRRDEVAQQVRDEQDQILLDLAKKCMEDDATLDRLAEMRPDDFSLKLMLPHVKEASRMLARIGPEFLSSVLETGKVRCLFSDFPPDAQQALCDWQNAGRERQMAARSEAGMEITEPQPFTPAYLGSLTFQVTRTSGIGSFPGFYLQVTSYKNGPRTGCMYSWPCSGLTDDQARVMTGRPALKKVLSASPLPDEPKITLEKLRLLAFRRGLLIGDVLEAVARQSDFDAVADFHFRGDSRGEIMREGFKDFPVRQAADRACETFLYTCQLDDNTLRFRFNKWFAEPVAAEPPVELIERFWTIVECNGRLDMRDLAALGVLPDEQIGWPGFRWMPGAGAAAGHGAFILLWNTLSDSDLAAAEVKPGLPVSRFSHIQRRRLDEWASAKNIQATGDEMDGSMLTTYTARLDYGWPDYGTGRNLVLTLPNGKAVGDGVDLPPPLKTDDRKELIAQRKADKEADVIEILH